MRKYVMNILEEIQNCPVEWKELGKVVDYEQPSKYIVSSKAYDDSNEIPVLTAGQSFILGYTNEKDGIYQASKNNPVIIFDDFTTSKQWVDFKFKVKSSAMKMLTIKDEFENEVLLRYVWHYLGTITYKPEQHGRQWIGTYSKFLIPIPPRKIQEKIVQILDKFTDYVTELTSELTSRKKQYSYYRDKLLSFEDEVYQVEWKTLGELCDVRDGTHDSPVKQSFGKYLITSKNVKNGSITFEDAYYISYEDFEQINKRSKVDVDDLLFTMIGTVGEIAHITDEPNFAIKNVSLIKPADRTLARYLFHYLQSTEAKKYIAENKSKGSQVFLALGKIRNFPIPYVSKTIQSRIVQVLDNFDKVCNDLNIGLPKEIELRQKQYEYFREKLLTFVAEGEYTESRVEEWDNSAIIKLLQWVFGPIRVELGAMARYRRTRIEATKLTSENYVGVDNLLQDRNGKTVATYLPEQGSFTGYDQGDILIGNIRPYLKKIWYANQSGGTNGDVLVIQNLFPSCLESQYLYYVLSDDRFFFYDMQYAKGSKMPRGDKAAIMQYKFILPPLSEQERIVSILDNFNTLTNSLSEGLPKEIELRQKQYEYWREQLLNFTR